MPRVKLSPEIKIAITAMSAKEKDKLLLRLVAKDDKLVEQLEFKLIEAEATREERRYRVSELIEGNLLDFQQRRFYPGVLTRTLRKTSARITRHVQVTKDKYGEIQLNLELVNRCLELFAKKLPTIPSRKVDSLYTYLIKKAMRIDTLLERLHEDYRLDFEDEIARLQREVPKHPLLHEKAVELGYL